jgi:hypothetical protein
MITPYRGIRLYGFLSASPFRKDRVMFAARNVFLPEVVADTRQPRGVFCEAPPGGCLTGF